VANPIAMLLSVELMLRYSAQRDDMADALSEAIASVLYEGYRTRDIAAEGEPVVGTAEMGDLVVARL
jgi:3-isopropylmalate dehydrogenase